MHSIATTTDVPKVSTTEIHTQQEHFNWFSTLNSKEQKRIALEGNPQFDYRTTPHNPGLEKHAIYKCIRCPTGFPQIRELLNHMRGHLPALNQRGRKVFCKKCDFKTNNHKNLDTHMYRHRLQSEPHLLGTTNYLDSKNSMKPNLYFSYNTHLIFACSYTP